MKRTRWMQPTQSCAVNTDPGASSPISFTVIDNKEWDRPTVVELSANQAIRLGRALVAAGESVDAARHLFTVQA